jgi:hypothetical protein
MRTRLSLGTIASMMPLSPWNVWCQSYSAGPEISYLRKSAFSAKQRRNFGVGAPLVPVFLALVLSAPVDASQLGHGVLLCKRGLLGGLRHLPHTALALAHHPLFCWRHGGHRHTTRCFSGPPVRSGMGVCASVDQPCAYDDTQPAELEKALSSDLDDAFAADGFEHDHTVVRQLGIDSREAVQETLRTRFRPSGCTVADWPMATGVDQAALPGIQEH